MSSAEALDSLSNAKEVELAYRAQAGKAVEKYNTAAAHDPHSLEAGRAWILRREALGQWKKARQDLEAARSLHRRALIMRSAGRAL